MTTPGMPLRFVVIERGETAPDGPFPRVVLRRDNWDDYSFRTTFFATLQEFSIGPAIDIGRVKILQRGQDPSKTDKTAWTTLPEQFFELSNEYCSLGQDIEYYEALSAFDGNFQSNYLIPLRDAAYNPAIETAFSGEPGWRLSLTRFGQAANALKAGRDLVRGQAKSESELSFTFNWRRNGTTTQVPFRFNSADPLPGRCHALIGYNGSGKTTLLGDLAMAASSGLNDHGELPDGSTISGVDTTFGAVITVSYSAFDTFQLPESPQRNILPLDGLDIEFDLEEVLDGKDYEHFGYVYCGLRREILPDPSAIEEDDFLLSLNKTPRPKQFELKSIEVVEAELADALRRSSARDRGGHLRKALDELSKEPSFGQAGIDLTAFVDTPPTQGGVQSVTAGLSTGHKIVLNIVTQLSAHLKTRSLVLVDEPETHLHPPLVAALLRAIQVLLNEHKSFAIIATHSPVVTQELPSKYVRILDRDSSGVELRDTEIETFAENIGTITRHVFSLDSSSTDYQGILADLARNFSVDEIESLFPRGISAQGRALIMNYKRTND